MAKLKRRSTAVTVAVLAALSMAAGAPDAGNGSKKSAIPPAVEEAIKSLAEEFEAVLKKPMEATSRTSSDYFAANDPGLTQEQLIALLKKKLNGNPRIDAFIKWQLMSALKGTFDEKHARDVLQIYQRAPKPPPRPGTTPREAQDLTGRVSRLSKDQLADANQQWQQSLEAHMRVNGPMLEYRRALYTALPKTLDTFNAGFNDAQQRIQLGYPAEDVLNTVLADVRTTAAGLSAKDMRRVGAMVSSWASSGSEKLNTTILDSIDLDKDGKVYFKTKVLKVDKRLLDDLLADLQNMAKTAT